MKILLQNKWKTNMGEAVLAKGARATLERAFPGAEIIENSGWSRKLIDMKQDGGLMNMLRMKVGMSKIRNEHMGRNAADLASLYDPDVIVIPGPSLHPEVYGAFCDIIGGDTPVLLLGTGSPRYDDETVAKSRQLIRANPADAVIVRNELAHSRYENSFSTLHEGIDNGFFINDWYTPPDFNGQLTALTFDKSPEPTNVETNSRIIRPHHTPFGMLYPDFLRHFFATGWSEEWYRNKGWFASDSLKDYLNVYANVDVTYTDRLHACVPTLAYGNKAVFDFDTPRQGVLDQTFIIERNGQLSVDRTEMEKQKSQQIELVRHVIETLTE